MNKKIIYDIEFVFSSSHQIGMKKEKKKRENQNSLT